MKFLRNFGWTVMGVGFLSSHSSFAQLPDNIEGSYGTFMYCQGCSEPAIKGETLLVILAPKKDRPAEITVHRQSGMRVVKFLVTKISEQGDYIQGDAAPDEQIPGSIRILFNHETREISGVISTVPSDIYIRGTQELALSHLKQTKGIVPTLSADELVGTYSGKYNTVHSQLTVKEKPEGGSYYAVSTTGSGSKLYFEHGEYDAESGVLVLFHEQGIKWTIVCRENDRQERLWTGTALSNMRGGPYPLEYKKTR